MRDRIHEYLVCLVSKSGRYEFKKKAVVWSAIRRHVLMW